MGAAPAPPAAGAPAVRLIGSRVALDALAEHSAPVAEKFLGESRGGFFQKAPSCASSLRHFLFASFSFVPTCSKEKEALWNLMTQSYSFHYSVSFHTRFSLQEEGAKKSYQKKRQREKRKRGIFEKIPLSIPQKLLGNRRRDVKLRMITLSFYLCKNRKRLPRRCR